MAVNSMVTTLDCVRLVSRTCRKGAADFGDRCYTREVGWFPPVRQMATTALRPKAPTGTAASDFVSWVRSPINVPILAASGHANAWTQTGSTFVLILSLYP